MRLQQIARKASWMSFRPAHRREGLEGEQILLGLLVQSEEDPFPGVRPGKRDARLSDRSIVQIFGNSDRSDWRKGGSSPLGPLRS